MQVWEELEPTDDMLVEIESEMDDYDGDMNVDDWELDSSCSYQWSEDDECESCQ